MNEPTGGFGPLVKNNKRTNNEHPEKGKNQRLGKVTFPGGQNGPAKTKKAGRFSERPGENGVSFGRGEEGAGEEKNVSKGG